MAAIAHSSKCAPWALVFGLLFALPASPDQSSDIRAALQRIATGLSEGNPADALKEFDPSFPNYDRLRDDFEGLTAGYQLTNEINIVDEQDTPNQTDAVVDWTLTLGNLTNPGIQDSRNQRIQVRFVRRKNHWKIIEFSPIDLFNPQFHPRSQNPPR